MACAVDDLSLSLFHLFIYLEPVSELEERLAQLHVSVPHDRYSESEETSSYSDRHSSPMEDLPSAFQDYIKGMVSRSCDYSVLMLQKCYSICVVFCQFFLALGVEKSSYTLVFIR